MARIDISEFVSQKYAKPFLRHKKIQTSNFTDIFVGVFVDLSSHKCCAETLPGLVGTTMFVLMTSKLRLPFYKCYTLTDRFSKYTAPLGDRPHACSLNVKVVSAEQLSEDTTC